MSSSHMSSADQLKLLLGLPEDSYGANSVDTLTLMKAANVLEDCAHRRSDKPDPLSTT